MTQGKLVAAAGRRSGFDGSTFAAVIKEVDVYDFEQAAWITLASPQGDVPPPRAGTASLTFGHLLIGGESGSKKLAHSKVDALDPVRGAWRSMPPLSTGRHASQLVLFEGNVCLPAGSITRGGNRFTRSLQTSAVAIRTIS